MCEKGRDQLIGKTDCEGEGERMEGSIGQQCVGWGGEVGVTGLVLSVGPMGRTIGVAGVGRVSHAFALWHGQQACATGVVSPPLRLLSNSWGSTGSHENRAPEPLMRGVLFLIKDGQAIITIIIRSRTMEHTSLSNGWENPPTEQRN